MDISEFYDSVKTGNYRVLRIERFKDGEKAVTVDMGGRIITLPRELSRALEDDALADVPPWYEVGWLESEFKRLGSIRAVGLKQGLTHSESIAMNTYSIKYLDWRIHEGNDLKRWELYDKFFGVADPKMRPKRTHLAEELGIPRSNVSLWLSEALAGKFFSAYMTLENLVLMQSGRFDYVYFPGEDAPRDWVLLKAKGWPKLPLGLLSDLLPRLSALEFVSAEIGATSVRLTLSYYAQPLVFDFAPQGVFPSQPSTLRRVESEGGALCLVFSTESVRGTIVEVHQVNAGNVLSDARFDRVARSIEKILV